MSVRDVVCGMTVDPATAKYRTTHAGQTFYFCSPSCQTRFEADPQRYLDAPGTAGMAVVPCSIKTAASIANSITDTLIARAADVSLKEGRPLVLVVRETPLHRGHLRQLLTLAELGAVILPPMPAFYLRPRTIEEIVDHTVGRVLDRLGLPHSLVPEWTGAR